MKRNLSRWVLDLALALFCATLIIRGSDLNGRPLDEQQTSMAMQPQISVGSTNTNQVGLYEKFEAVLLLQNASYQNPYDPEQIDVQALFTSPTGVVWNIFAFYDNFDNRNQWKVRFSPNEPGTWKYTLQARDFSGTGASVEYTFTAVSSQHHGGLKVSPVNPHYLVQDDGTSFYGVGPAYPWTVNDGSSGLALLQAMGGNMFYYWNIMYDTGGSIIESLTSGMGKYDQPKCGRIDQVIEWAENRGMKIMLSIWPHDLLCDAVSGWPRQWLQNPYKQIVNVKEFYASDAAWEYQEKQYRYLIARWGHSRSMGIWELVCEINGTDGWAFGDREDVLYWVERAYDFIKQSDPYKRPITVSQSGGIYWPDGYELVDLPNVHLYETSWTARYPSDPLRSSLWIYGDITQKFWQDFEKPGILGEAGYTGNYGNYSPSSSEYVTLYHNALWVTWANGLAATPLWWDYGTKSIFTNTFLEQMHSFSKIAQGIDYANIVFSPATVLTSDCDAYGMEGDSFAFGWIRAISGKEVHGQIFNLQGLTDASYSVQWINTWTGEIIKTNARASQNGLLIDQIPQSAQSLNDIAFIVRPAESGDIPYKLELMAYPTELFSDTSYTSLVTCFVLDDQDRLCKQAQDPVTFTLIGPGALEGNAEVVPNNGIANVTYRANFTAGMAQIIATVAGLIADTLSIPVNKFLHIDDFEGYTSETELQAAWQKRYGTDTFVYWESSVLEEGRKAMRLEYSIGNSSLTYAGVTRPIAGDWSRANSLAFWLKSNGSKHQLSIRLNESSNRYWYYNYPLDSSDSATVTIALDAFVSNYGAKTMDATMLTEIMLNLNKGNGDWGSGTLYFDNFRFLAFKTTDISSNGSQDAPLSFNLAGNYPNPFNNETVIEYSVPNAGKVRVTIHNMIGQLIETLVDAGQRPGRYKIAWNADRYASGIYFYRIEATGFAAQRKCLLIK
jgi:hypothetical protein